MEADLENPTVAEAFSEEEECRSAVEHHERMARLNVFLGNAGRAILALAVAATGALELLSTQSELFGPKGRVVLACVPLILAALVANASGVSQVRAKNHRSRALSWGKQRLRGISNPSPDPTTDPWVQRALVKDAILCPHDDRSLQRSSQTGASHRTLHQPHSPSCVAVFAWHLFYALGLFFR